MNEKSDKAVFIFKQYFTFNSIKNRKNHILLQMYEEKSYQLVFSNSLNYMREESAYG